MSLTIGNPSLHRVSNSLQVNAQKVQQSMQNIASGSKLNQAKNNPSAYAIYVSMSAQTRALDQSTSNTQTSNALLKTAAGAASNTVSALTSMKEKLIQAANGTNNASDRSILQNELNQTISSINDNASTTFNGKTLIDGSLSGSNALQVATSEGMQNVSIDDMRSDSLGLTTDGGSTPTIDLSTPQGIRDAMDTVDSALEKAISQEASIGASQQALDYKANNLTTSSENITGAASTIGDANIAKEAMNLSQNMTLQQMKTYVLAHANQSSFNVLGLLQ